MTHDARLPPRDRFEGYYAAPRAPWDIGRPQRAFVKAADAIRGRVIDIGCGTGDLALWLAERGCTVTGVDFLEKPLEWARQKAAERGLSMNFLQMDAVAVGEIPERFDAVTDCGLFQAAVGARLTCLPALLCRLRARNAWSAPHQRTRTAGGVCRRMGGRDNRTCPLRGRARHSWGRIRSRRCPGLVCRDPAGLNRWLQSRKTIFSLRATWSGNRRDP
jgi:SAM-dependent methyltransferase